jgi:hypothetical protein
MQNIKTTLAVDNFVVSAVLAMGRLSEEIKQKIHYGEPVDDLVFDITDLRLFIKAINSSFCSWTELQKIQRIEIISNRFNLVKHSSYDLSWLQRITLIAKSISSGGFSTEKLFLASPAYTIETIDILQWNEAFLWGNHEDAGYSPITHNHDDLYEAVFFKNTGFNKDFGSLAGTVAEGNHLHNFNAITDRPTTLLGYGITDSFSGAYSALSGIPSTFAPSAHTHLWEDITNAPPPGEGGGSVDIHGTPNANQLAIWHNGYLIKGDNKISWNGTILNVTGDIITSGKGIFQGIVADDAIYTGIVTSDGGELKYRTRAQILSDIAAVGLAGTQTITGSKIFSNRVDFTRDNGYWLDFTRTVGGTVNKRRYAIKEVYDSIYIQALTDAGDYVRHIISIKHDGGLDVLSGNLQINNGNLQVDSGDVNVLSGGIHYLTPDFTSGFTGSGSRLTRTGGNWNLELDNLRVRGTMSIYELEVNKIRATNGTLWVTSSSKVLEGLLFDNKGFYFTTELDENYFDDDDIIKAQFRFEGGVVAYTYVVNDIDVDKVYVEALNETYDEVTFPATGYVTNYDGDIEVYMFDVAQTSDSNNINLKKGKYKLNLSYADFGSDPLWLYLVDSGGGYIPFSLYLSGSGSNETTFYIQQDYTNAKFQFHSGEPEYDDIYFSFTKFELLDLSVDEDNISGRDFVRIGNRTNPNRQGSVYITGDDADAPYLDVLDGVDSDDFTDKRKARLGNLTGLTDASFGALSGYGLYSENVYLKGAIVANSGLVGGFTIHSTDGLYAGTGATRVQMTAGSGFWSGATLIEDAPFSVTNAGVLKATSGEIAGWTLATDSQYTGTKSLADGYNNEPGGGITLGADGSIHAPNFYMNTDGTIGMREASIESSEQSVDGGTAKVKIEGSEISHVYTIEGGGGAKTPTMYINVSDNDLYGAHLALGTGRGEHAIAINASGFVAITYDLATMGRRMRVLRTADASLNLTDAHHIVIGTRTETGIQTFNLPTNEFRDAGRHYIFKRGSTRDIRLDAGSGNSIRVTNGSVGQTYDITGHGYTVELVWDGVEWAMLSRVPS